MTKKRYVNAATNHGDRNPELAGLRDLGGNVRELRWSDAELAGRGETFAADLEDDSTG